MTLIAADSHVHFHECFDEGLFFDSCFNNIRINLSEPIQYCLLFLTEGKKEDSYNQLKLKKKIKSLLTENTDYILSGNDEGNSIIVECNKTNMRMIIFPGFQIVTKENLEVLSLGTKKRLTDGSSIEDTISDVISLGGIPVLPWAFGKWYGNRGKKIDELIRKKSPRLFLGDNGGRSNLIPYPTQFHLAESNGKKILPGSDPLPFPIEAKRPMSFGFCFEADFNYSKPWESVRETLLNTDLKIVNFGKLTSPLNFIKTQIAMQIKKRTSK